MIKNGKKFLDPKYRERKERLDVEDVSITGLRHHVHDITFLSKFARTSRTIRAQSVTVPADYNDVPEGFGKFWDGGKAYAYNPDEVRLVSLEGDSPVTLAEGDAIFRIDRIGFPQRPKVGGVVQEDVEATVYYWSDRSDELQSVTIDVDRVEENTSNPWRINGYDVTDSDRKIEAMVRQERDIISKTWRSSDVTIGKVARVEFPKGHRYTVDIGIEDDKAKDAVETIEKRLTRRRGYDDVEVSHEGRIPE